MNLHANWKKRFMIRHLKTKTLKFLTSLAFFLLWPCTCVALERKPKGLPLIKSLPRLITTLCYALGWRAYQSYLADGNPATEDAKCNLLGRLVINKLMVAKAEIDSVVVSDLEVRSEYRATFNYILQSSGPAHPTIWKKSYGKSLDEIRWISMIKSVRTIAGQWNAEKITDGCFRYTQRR